MTKSLLEVVMMSFSQFLKEVCDIPADKLSQYERWVAMYRERLTSRSSSSEDPSPAPFLESLGPKVEKWQVAQARRAIQLYWYYKQKTIDGRGFENGRGRLAGGTSVQAV